MTIKSWLRSLSEGELLRLYATLIKTLREKGITQSGNSPVADYAKKRAIQTLGLVRADKRARGYDAEDRDGNKYRIKGRRITRHNNSRQSRQLGVIRSLDEHPFDFLVAVIFDENFNVLDMWKIPRQWIKENVIPSEHQNGHIVQASPDIMRTSKRIEKVI